MSGYEIWIFLEKNGKTICKSGNPDQMLHFAVSDLGLRCLQIILLGVSKLQWVKVPVSCIMKATHRVEEKSIALNKKSFKTKKY